ncbi:ankyrin repeat-containing protein BDA1-like [Papaver somniferum]|nr:ankyrin repeat-containing protein BDA1-like [Papaver somniferum]
MEKLLYEVSLKGDVKSLKKILNLDRRLRLEDVALTSFLRTPLHIAAVHGHIKFAKAILDMKKVLTTVRDSQGLTPLHLASATGETEMVKLLLKANVDACTIQDQDGRTPMHLAAMKDEVSILKLLIERRPEAVHLMTDRNETVLHYCVKNRSFEALKFLLEYQIGAQPTDRNVMSVNSRDDAGNTILHIAAETRNMKIMGYLVSNKHIKVEINAFNNNSDKAFDMLSQTERNDLEFGVSDSYGSAN